MDHPKKTAKNEDEDYWYKSEKKSFNFDDDSESSDQVCGFTQRGAAKLYNQLRDGLKLDIDVTSDSSADQFGSKKESKYDLAQLVSEKVVNAILEAEYADIQVSKSSLKPDEELKLLRRQVLGRWDTPDSCNVINSIILGKPYSLELFQSLKSKNDLLAAALASGDGNAILEVTLFLDKTLKKSLFQQIMFNNPVAVSHYIHYMTTKMQIQEATDLLELLGRHKEASFKQFQIVSTNPQRHLQRLKTLGAKYFFDSKDKIFVDNFARLVERQIEFKEEVGASVVSTLRTLCEKHWNDASTITPFVLSKEHCVSDKQFQWTALTARASQQDWESIHAMFITKGWLGAKKVKSAIPMDQIVTQLHQFKAPEDVLIVYLNLIEDLDLKLSVAKKLQCHKVIIDTLSLQRDRQSLKSYMSSISSG